VVEDYRNLSNKELPDPTTTVRYHELRDILRDLLEEGAELLVSPSSSDIDRAQTIFQAIEMLIEQNSSHVATTFVNETYRHGSAVINNRFELLDALASRKALAGDWNGRNADVDGRKGPFRGAARLFLADALRNGVKGMGVVRGDDISSFCSLKAWEIESALFERYQGEQGGHKITPEYRDKARALKRSIEDVGNITLCARIASGGICAGELVKMSTEQLANPSTKRQRANAERKQNRILTGIRKPPPQNSIPNADTKPPPHASRLASESETSQPNIAVTPALPASSMSSLTLRPSKFGDLVKTARSSRPPPPPSLASTLMSNPGAPDPPGKSDLVSSTLGGDRFILTVSESSCTFMAGFYAEKDEESIADGLLPEQLREKRRTPVKAFTQFVRDKLKSQKWTPLLLRLNTWSENDAQEYRKFYKDYESRDRIATFLFNESEKLYLVTPKFQRHLRESITFENRSSSYGLVLVRRKES
jgi:hypothetical protein